MFTIFKKKKLVKDEKKTIVSKKVYFEQYEVIENEREYAFELEIIKASMLRNERWNKIYHTDRTRFIRFRNVIFNNYLEHDILENALEILKSDFAIQTKLFPHDIVAYQSILSRAIQNGFCYNKKINLDFICKHKQFREITFSLSLGKFSYTSDRLSTYLPLELDLQYEIQNYLMSIFIELIHTDVEINAEKIRKEIYFKYPVELWYRGVKDQNGTLYI